MAGAPTFRHRTSADLLRLIGEGYRALDDESRERPDRLRAWLGSADKFLDPEKQTLDVKTLNELAEAGDDYDDDVSPAADTGGWDDDCDQESFGRRRHCRRQMKTESD